LGDGDQGQPQTFDPFIAVQIRINQIALLPIEMRHIVRVSGLPLHHRDPFDRMLAALGAYGVRRLW